jgi:VWFA-related protein
MRNASEAVYGSRLGAILGMPLIRALLHGAVFLSLTLGSSSIAEGQQAAPASPTFRVTSNLVFLDVTVLDKKGHPVVTGLTKDDFTITENKKPQRIFSFDAPAQSTGARPQRLFSFDAPTAGNAGSAGSAPATILVLDLLNTRFEDSAFARDSVRRYLALQPAQLDSPTELMVLNNTSLDMVQSYTRSRADLMYALDHVPPALPYKLSGGDWIDQRLSQSIEALQQIALQNKGLPGRKNILWIGNGGPSMPMDPADPRYAKSMRFYAHGTTNMLVDARMSLFLINPEGVKGAQNPDYLRIGRVNALYAEDAIEGDPFAGSINFGLLVRGTGGVFFHDRNDVDAEMQEAQKLGSNYYTLTYQPAARERDGKFREVKVTLRDPSLRAMTKTGYYAPEEPTAADPLPQPVNAMNEISEAAQSSVVFDTLGLTIVRVVRHPDSNTAQLTVLLKSTNLRWQATNDGGSGANVTVAAVSLSGRRDILASKLQRLTVLSNSQDAVRLAQSNTLLTVTVPVPRHTARVRVVIRTDDGGQVGTAELDQKSLQAAAESPTPDPKLLERPRPVTMPTQ